MGRGSAHFVGAVIDPLRAWNVRPTEPHSGLHCFLYYDFERPESQYPCRTLLSSCALAFRAPIFSCLVPEHGVERPNYGLAASEYQHPAKQKVIFSQLALQM